ncbi:MAG: DUF3052 domain-containing protein [Actinomycetota bacterium]
MSEKDYSGTPLYKKLGIKSGSSVAFVNAPDGFVSALAMPPGVELTDKERKDLDVAVVFVTRLKDLRARFPKLADAVYPAGGLWIAYPKKSSSIEGDLNFDNVQQLGLDEGLVDNKSCAIDEDYSGLRFVYRLEDR